jgi:uncharacterized membrane protein YeaQ/YmgE (transglycosylase-associated protein family)
MPGTQFAPRRESEKRGFQAPQRPLRRELVVITAFISWVVFGLAVGLIARALYPGRQALSLPNTIALGVAGSVVGGLIAWALGYRPDEGAFAGAGWILSILGALVIVWASLAWTRRRA